MFQILPMIMMALPHIMGEVEGMGVSFGTMEVVEVSLLVEE
jgi:hypothetical protein